MERRQALYWSLGAGVLWSVGLFAGATMAGWCQGLHPACFPLLPVWIGTWFLIAFPVVIFECAGAALIFSFVPFFKGGHLRLLLIVLVTVLESVLGFVSGHSLGAL